MPKTFKIVSNYKISQIWSTDAVLLKKRIKRYPKARIQIELNTSRVEIQIQCEKGLKLKVVQIYPKVDPNVVTATVN